MPVVWRFIDGKPGHERQTAGFIKALKETSPCTVVEISAVGGKPYWSWLTKRYPNLEPLPDLIIGAGSACQAPMLSARRTHGGKTIYFMRPKFPVGCFDLCVIPKHDRPPKHEKIAETEGVLNDFESAAQKKPLCGVILIGGPSKHHGWDTTNLSGQVKYLVDNSPERRYILSASRRTPREAIPSLENIANLDYHAVEKTNSDWLPATLAVTDTVWVTPDSVSMMYEALSVGANLGVFEMPLKGNDRITRISQDLIARGYATAFSQWRDTNTLLKSPTLREANRIATEVKIRFPQIFG